MFPKVIWAAVSKYSQLRKCYLSCQLQRSVVENTVQAVLSYIWPSTLLNRQSDRDVWSHRKTWKLLKEAPAGSYSKLICVLCSCSTSKKKKKKIHELRALVKDKDSMSTGRRNAQEYSTCIDAIIFSLPNRSGASGDRCWACSIFIQPAHTNPKARRHPFRQDPTYTSALNTRRQPTSSMAYWNFCQYTLIYRFGITCG